MGGMPYLLEKGAVYAVYEDYLAEADQRGALLQNLRNPHVPMWDVVALESMTLAPPGAAVLKDHTRVHWLGNPVKDAPLAHGPVNSCRWTSPAGPQTGWWSRWSGPAENILRSAFLRAIEVSLGIAHQEPTCAVGQAVDVLEPPIRTANLPANATRFWDIEFLWVCGAPALQAWVTWRGDASLTGNGQVTVIMATPPPVGGTAHNMYMNPEADDPITPDMVADGYLVDPNTAGDVQFERGMWVIGAQQTDTIATDTTMVVNLAASDIDQDGDPDFMLNIVVITPSSRHQSGPAIVTVRPSQEDGGVHGNPTLFVAVP